MRGLIDEIETTVKEKIESDFVQQDKFRIKLDIKTEHGRGYKEFSVDEIFFRSVSVGDEVVLKKELQEVEEE